jgi:malate dehydrogenase
MFVVIFVYNYFCIFIIQKSGGAKVALLGAAGGIGQPMGLLLKQNPLIARLSLYDIQHTPGVAADLSHMNTRAQV